MTHDFHYYVTFMCARNAGFDQKTSREIALCADAVDGGNPKCAQQRSNKFKEVQTIGKKGYRPLTVYNMGHSVNMKHSIGGSIVSIPWMAFHFLPSLQVGAKGLKVDKNDYRIVRETPGRKTPVFARGDNPRTSKDELRLSQVLENGLICTQNSLFAKKLIADTSKAAFSLNPAEKAAFLGVRAHIIADLFAHEGFAGCRSVNVNALEHAYTENEEARAKNKPFCLAYTLAMAAGASTVKVTKAGRLGHGQAGQRPDEPFVKFAFKRVKGEGGTLFKDNYDLFGRALMAVTEVLRGRDIEKLGKQYEDWYKFEDKENYIYKWKHIRSGMNQSRENRRLFLRFLILSTENEGCDTNDSRFFDPDLHDGSDYWAFDKMSAALLSQFSMAADGHLKWFHDTFYELSRCTIDQYMQVSVLWPFQDDDDWHAIEINRELVGMPETKIELKGTHGKAGLTGADATNFDYGPISGTQIGAHYMKSQIKQGPDKREKREVAEALKPSDVYAKMDSRLTL